MHSEDAHADCGNDMCEPASRGQPTQGSLANSLGWLPNSYYRLRDSTLVARIVAVEAGGLRGEIFPAAKLKWVNESPSIASAETISAEEWDLGGNSRCEAAHDLMELIR